MTSPQPQPPVQYVYVQREPTQVMPIFGWLTAVFSFLFYPLSGTSLTLIAIVAWFTSVGLTVGSSRNSRRSAHWIMSVSMLGLSTVVFVIYFLATVLAKIRERRAAVAQQPGRLHRRVDDVRH